MRTFYQGVKTEFSVSDFELLRAVEDCSLVVALQFGYLQLVPRFREFTIDNVTLK